VPPLGKELVSVGGSSAWPRSGLHAKYPVWFCKFKGVDGLDTHVVDGGHRKSETLIAP
jgi:hypothetical protein